MSTSVPHQPKAIVRALAEAPEEEWDDERGRLRFKTVFGADESTSQLVLGRCIIEPGNSLQHHSHDATEIYHVISGTGTVLLDGTRTTIQAGDSVFIPGGTPHSLHATGPHDLEFVYVYAADSANSKATAYTMQDPRQPASHEDG